MVLVRLLWKRACREQRKESLGFFRVREGILRTSAQLRALVCRVMLPASCFCCPPVAAGKVEGDSLRFRQALPAQEVLQPWAL